MAPIHLFLFALTLAGCAGDRGQAGGHVAHAIGLHVPGHGGWPLWRPRRDIIGHPGN